MQTLNKEKKMKFITGVEITILWMKIWVKRKSEVDFQ
jgi:hypothetical protein